jgi:2-succinyl-6-hydroxy-2,4-cyclohexadiene-1-carboxylate synthase
MREKIRSFDGTKINYDIRRQDNKKTFLVFIHGVGSNLKVWKKIRLFFNKLKIPTIAIDLRGHGRSGKPKNLKDYDLKNSARDIKEVLKKENIQHPIIIGYSMGGMVTLAFQGLYPNFAKKYIIISSSYKTPKKLRIIAIKLASIIKFLNKKLELVNPPVINEYGDNNPFFSRKDLHFGRIFNDMKKTSFKSWLFSLENINQFNEAGILKAITKPVLILSGGQDNIISVSNSKRLHHLIKNSKLKVFPKENHIMILTNPKTICGEIYSFIQKK